VIEFIPMCLFKFECWSSSVGVSNWNKLELMFMGRWSEPRPEMVRQSHVGAN